MLTIPVPPRELNPNVKIHYKKKAQIFLKYKTDVYRIVKQMERPVFGMSDIHLFIDFYPPNKHGRDADNALASLKAAIDGIAMHWGINDKRFNPITVHIKEMTEGGMVSIRYEQKQEYVPIVNNG